MPMSTVTQAPYRSQGPHAISPILRGALLQMGAATDPARTLIHTAPTPSGPPDVVRHASGGLVDPLTGEVF